MVVNKILECFCTILQLRLSDYLAALSFINISFILKILVRWSLKLYGFLSFSSDIGAKIIAKLTIVHLITKLNSYLSFCEKCTCFYWSEILFVRLFMVWLKFYSKCLYLFYVIIPLEYELNVLWIYRTL